MLIHLDAERDKRRNLTVEAPCHAAGRMTDEEYEAQVERVVGMVRNTLPTIRLGEFTPRLQLVPGPIDDDGAVMYITSDWRYKFLTLTASVEKCAEESDGELLYDICHEGAHVFLSRMRKEDPSEAERSIEELTATDIGQGYVGMYEEGCEVGDARGYARGRAESEAEIAELRAENERLRKKKAA